MRPRPCRTTSSTRVNRAATIEAATLGRPTMTRITSPSTATPMTKPSGMMRAAMSASAANINRPTTPAVTRLTAHTSIAPGLTYQTAYHALASIDGDASPDAGPRQHCRSRRQPVRRHPSADFCAFCVFCGSIPSSLPAAPTQAASHPPGLRPLLGEAAKARPYGLPLEHPQQTGTPLRWHQEEQEPPPSRARYLTAPCAGFHRERVHPIDLSVGDRARSALLRLPASPEHRRECPQIVVQQCVLHHIGVAPHLMHRLQCGRMPTPQAGRLLGDDLR